MEVYFTSPTLGRIYGTITTEDHITYIFKGRAVLICIELYRTQSGIWDGQKEHWLHDHQIKEMGVQIDQMEKWLFAQ